MHIHTIQCYECGEDIPENNHYISKSGHPLCEECSDKEPKSESDKLLDELPREIRSTISNARNDSNVVTELYRHKNNIIFRFAKGKYHINYTCEYGHWDDFRNIESFCMTLRATIHKLG